MRIGHDVVVVVVLDRGRAHHWYRVESSRVESSRVSMFDGEIMSVGCETTLFVDVFVLPGRLETISTFSGYFRTLEP